MNTIKNITNIYMWQNKLVKKKELKQKDKLEI